MKIRIISFGKIRNPNIYELELYYKKLVSRHFKIDFLSLKDIPDRKINKGDINNYFVSSYKNIILSEIGTSLSTHGLKNKIHKWMIQSQDIQFFIGNAFGFDDNIKSRADLIFSLSKLTFPHEIAKVLLIEQLFRVGDILKGGRYHK